MIDKYKEEAGSLVKKPCGYHYVGVISNIRDEQRIVNMRATALIDNLDKFNAFESWFNSYSFKWVPDFCKPMIKGWVKDAYLCSLGRVGSNG